MTAGYDQFKERWLKSQGNPATGYDGDQESVIKSAYIESLEAKVRELSRLAEHGNGPVLLGWMDAHKKAMDRLEEAEKDEEEAVQAGATLYAEVQSLKVKLAEAHNDADKERNQRLKWQRRSFLFAPVDMKKKWQTEDEQ